MKYRAWSITNIPSAPEFDEVESPEAGAKLIHDMSLEQLAMPWVHSNAFGLEMLEDDGKWHEWYDEEGDDVGALEEKLFPYPCTCHKTLRPAAVGG